MAEVADLVDRPEVEFVDTRRERRYDPDLVVVIVMNRGVSPRSGSGV